MIQKTLSAGYLTSLYCYFKTFFVSDCREGDFQSMFTTVLLVHLYFYLLGLPKLKAKEKTFHAQCLSCTKPPEF